MSIAERLRQQGRQEGRQEGERNKQEEIVRKMKAAGLSQDLINKITETKPS